MDAIARAWGHHPAVNITARSVPDRPPRHFNFSARTCASMALDG